MVPEELTKTLRLNLQFFAEEKTEKATPKKRQKAREQGQLVKSREFNSAVVLLVAFFAIKLFFPYVLSQISGFFHEIFNLIGSEEFQLNSQMAQRLSLSVINVSVRSVLPIAGFTLLAGVAANLVQSGFYFSAGPLKPNLNSLNPISGLKNMVSLRSVIELIKSLVKISIVGYVAYRIYRGEFNKFPHLLDMSIQASIMYIGQLIIKMSLQIGFCLLVFSIFDYWYQKWEYERKLKMTKQEVKEEYKQREGDPQVKAAIKSKQRQMSMARMMQMVPQADVVITNPTHFAVALKYDGQTMEAPEVIAKGQDYVAQKIKAIAREHDVTLVENKPLAQALFKSVEVGQAIPAELFQAVAEVLAFVYRIKGKI